MDECVGGFEFAMDQGAMHRKVGVRPAIAEEMDERQLEVAFAGYAAGADEREGFV